MIGNFYQFRDNALFERAVTHPSYCRGRRKHIKSYERLEFLGDSVLGLAVADILFEFYPEASEGDLAVMHSNLINTRAISHCALKIGLDSAMRMDEGEEKNGGRLKHRNLENAMEAVIAAIYLDGGFPVVKEIVRRLWDDLLSAGATIKNRDSKTILQEFAQKHALGLPSYKMLEQKGLSHDPSFIVEVSISPKEGAQGEGKSKKEAEQSAATNLLHKLNMEK
jgi:ribonuclease-3